MIPRMRRRSHDSIIQYDVTGIVTYYNEERRNGFIKMNDTYNKVFFHLSECMYKPVEVRHKVTFDLYEGPKGYFAAFVEFVCVEPEDSMPESGPREGLIQTGVNGVVKQYDDKRGFGFIRVNEKYSKVFFHQSDVSSGSVQVRDNVTFDLHEGPKGYQAESVQLCETRVVDTDSDTELHAECSYRGDESFDSDPDVHDVRVRGEKIHEDRHERSSVTGIVKQYDDKRGFGFITEDDTNNKVFFHKTEVSYHSIANGDKVTFDLYEGPKGYFAQFVKPCNKKMYDSDFESSTYLEEEDFDFGPCSDTVVDSHRDESLGDGVHGVVQRYDVGKRFGFIYTDDTNDRVFFHKSEVLYDFIEVGDVVTFDLYKGHKGYNARSVHLRSRKAHDSDFEFYDGYGYPD